MSELTPYVDTRSHSDVFRLIDEGNEEALWKISELNTRMPNTGMTPLHWALEHGKRQIARDLILRRVDVNVQDKFGWTPLMLASQVGFDEIVQDLLDKKADLELKNNKGNTALYIAKVNGRNNVISMLESVGTICDRTRPV